MRCKESETRSDCVLVKHNTLLSVFISLLFLGKIIQKKINSAFFLYSYSRTSWLHINKIQRDVTVCRCLFTTKLLFMFRVSIAPIIRSTSLQLLVQVISHVRATTFRQRGLIRLWHVIWPVPEAAVTVCCTADDGCDGHPKHVE